MIRAIDKRKITQSIAENNNFFVFILVCVCIFCVIFVLFCFALCFVFTPTHCHVRLSCVQCAMHKNKSDKRPVTKSTTCVCQTTAFVAFVRHSGLMALSLRLQWKMLKYYYLLPKSNWTTNSFTTLWRLERAFYLFIYLFTYLRSLTHNMTFSLCGWWF